MIGRLATLTCMLSRAGAAASSARAGACSKTARSTAAIHQIRCTTDSLSMPRAYTNGVRLSAEQLQRFDQDGYLFFPSLFTPPEIQILLDEVPALYAQRRPENVREKTG